MIDLGLVRPPVSDDTLAVHVIQESPFVLLSRQTWAGLYDEILGLCHQVGFSPLIRQEAFEFQTVIGLVAAGLGVAVVPPSAQNLHTRDVVYRQVDGLMPSAAMGIAWRRNDASPLISEFIGLAKQTTGITPLSRQSCHRKKLMTHNPIQSGSNDLPQLLRLRFDTERRPFIDLKCRHLSSPFTELCKGERVILLHRFIRSLQTVNHFRKLLFISHGSPRPTGDGVRFSIQTLGRHVKTRPFYEPFPL